MKLIVFLLIGFCAISKAVAADPNSLQTVSENRIGLSAGYYYYREPSLDMVLDAPLVGIDYSGIYKFNPQWFVQADARYAYGRANYSGSGTQKNIPNWYYELRGLLGRDFQINDHVLAPYGGLGYRYLMDDQTGVTSTGSASYRRESTYWYIPVGITHRMRLGVNRLETNLEFDYLIQGTQVSHLSDTIGKNGITQYGDISNAQNRGFGARFSSLYQFEKWSMGPYITYWNIGQSNTVTTNATINATQYQVRAYEPSNYTVEAGLRIAYRF